MSDGLLTEEQREAMRRSAEDVCTHEDEWISRTEPNRITEACWGCLIDAYFALRLGDA